MKPTKLNHAPPSINQQRYIDEVRKMTPQQRYEKLMAIIEVSYALKNAPKKRK